MPFEQEQDGLHTLSTVTCGASPPSPVHVSVLACSVYPCVALEWCPEPGLDVQQPQAELHVPGAQVSLAASSSLETVPWHALFPAAPA